METCANCKFNIDEHCRRFPRIFTLGKTWEYPPVVATDWCGDHNNGRPDIAYISPTEATRVVPPSLK